MRDEIRPLVLSREAARLFSPKLDRYWHQAHIDVIVGQSDIRKWELEEISARIIWPAIRTLASYLPDDSFPEPYDWPTIPGVLMGQAEWNGWRIRYVEYYDIYYDTVRIQLSVRFHSRKHKRREDWRRFRRRIRLWLSPWRWDWG